jgi:type II secretory pathway pseudopilin PulG
MEINKRQGAFTLAEMAIVVVLAGIILTLGLKMTKANLTNGAYLLTASNQAQIKLALINYMRTNGVLPCPDQHAYGSAQAGTSSSPCIASAAAGSGRVPWATLNISKDTVVDGWGNFFTYRVANGTAGIVKDWTSKTAANSFDINELKTSSAAMTIMQGDGSSATVQVTNLAVVAIVSFGPNGYGALTQQGAATSVTTPPAANTDEVTNATAGSIKFVIRPYAQTAAVGGPFDDRVVYMIPQDILEPLVTEQSLSTCRAYCLPCVGSDLPASSPYCTGAGTPSTAIGQPACTNATTPYPGCGVMAGHYPGVCSVAATNPVPVGNPTPYCP